LASLRRFVLVLTAPVALARAVLACGDGGPPNDVFTDDAATPPSPPEAGFGGNEAAVPSGTIRFAHVADGVGPIDFCYRAAGTANFVGPVISGGGAQADGGPSDAAAHADADAEAEAGPIVFDDAGAPAVAPRAVTAYLTLAAAGSVRIAVVARGAASCTDRIVETDVTLDPGKLVTVALVGSGAVYDAGNMDEVRALGLVAFTDDRSTVADKARVRVIHAALAGELPSLTVRAVGAIAVPLADDVAPRHAASASATIPVDSLGYATAAPLASPAAIGVDPVADADGGGPSWQSAAADLGLSGGSLHTAFVVTGAPYAVLWCTDTSLTGDRTTCAVLK
jgi:hypothetical protein